MAGIDDLKLRCAWLAKALAYTCRGLNPPARFAGQKFVVSGDPNNPEVDAVVEVYEPATGARDVVAGTWPTGSVKKTQTQVQMFHKDDGLVITHEELSQAMKKNEIPTVVKVVAAGVMESLNSDMLPPLVRGFFNYAGTVGAVPSDAAHLRAMRAAMGDRTQGCYAPDDNSRVLLAEPSLYSSLLGVSEFVIASSVGQAETMRTGRLTGKYGFGEIAECSYLAGVNSTAGTATADLLVNGDHAAGKNFISLVSAGGGTVKIGQEITFAGATQRHTVRGKITSASPGSSYVGRMTYADCTLAAGVADTVEIYPPLPAAVLDTTQVTVLATHGIASLGFHPLAAALVTRKFPDYEPGTGIVNGDAMDTDLGLAFRVHTGADYQRNKFAVSVCAGMALVIPRWGVRGIRTAN